MNAKTKNRTIGVVCFFAGVLAAVIGFVLCPSHSTSCGQEEAEAEPVVAMVDEQTMREHEPFYLPALNTSRCEELPVAAIERGSWWTDGDVYYQVQSNAGDSVYMVGTTFEESGMELLFRIDDESAMHTDGASCFAMHDSPVLARQIRMPDGSYTRLLVAYYDNDLLRPQAILQCYNGNELKNQSIY